MKHQESDAYAVVLGQAVSARRKRRGLSQADLAAAAGVTQSTISRIEAGKLVPDAFLVRRIATALGEDPGHFQHFVEQAYARTEKTAQSATGPGEAPWWQTAFAIAGIAGLVGLAAFVVSAMQQEEDDDEP